MKQFFILSLLFLRIFIIIKVVVLLYDSRNGFYPEQIDSSLWWALLLILDIWIQFSIPINNNDKVN